jgi:hypothetical protein
VTVVAPALWLDNFPSKQCFSCIVTFANRVSSALDVSFTFEISSLAGSAKILSKLSAWMAVFSLKVS